MARFLNVTPSTDDYYLNFENQLVQIQLSLIFSEFMYLTFYPFRICSATWPKEVRKLSEEFLTDPCYVTVGSINATANHNILQVQLIVAPRRN